MNFGIEKNTVYKVTCGDVDLTHITVEDYGSGQYIVYSNGEEIDVFTYNGNKVFDAIVDYLSNYAINNGFVN
jgi:hypothetical protein